MVFEVGDIVAARRINTADLLQKEMFVDCVSCDEGLVIYDGICFWE